MFGADINNTVGGKTTYKIVLPFYAYAALSLLVSTILLFFSAKAFTQHYFHPHILAITHMMALGWGTMIILGASHQLVPVLIEKNLYSTKLGYATFILAGLGIPLLVYGFYKFDMEWPAKWGGRLILLATICYVINLAATMADRKKTNVHAVYILTASVWLLLTVFFGLTLVYNFTFSYLPKETLKYLPLHAHIGIIGWFLLLVTGVGSRLIPMFLISKYTNARLLWSIYLLINIGLLTFVLSFFYFPGTSYYKISIAAVLLALFLFAHYCYSAFKERIRKLVDDQMKTSLLSVMLMLLPVIFLVIITWWLLSDNLNVKMVLIYGFAIFFGWITVIIFGMTFKTLPFIVWNKVYHEKAGLGKTPNPKDLFSNRLFIVMILVYLSGFILFISGAYLADTIVLSFAAIHLVLAAILYNWNVIKVLFHKPTKL